VNFRQGWLRWAYAAGVKGIVFVSLLFTTGCGVDIAGLLQSKTATPTPNGIFGKTPTSAATSQATRYASITPSGPQTLVIWLPPQFDPGAATPAAEKLRTRLASFEAENPGYKIQVRIKASNGPGGLVDELSTAGAAAPAVLPALVALSRSDLETAALKGLVYPLDNLSHQIDDPDWYPYARQLAMIQGSTFGLPFAGDGMILLYRPAKLPNPPADWPGLIKAGLPIAFPAADSQATVTLLLYLSAGGQVKDSLGRPQLQADPLTRVLRLIDDGVKGNIFPNWLAQYQTDGQAWQAYRDQRAQLLITWSSRYLADLPADTAACPIPSLGSQPMTLATGWVWAISTPQPERRAIAARLAEYLASSDFLAQWNSASGYLPPRPSAMATWSNQGMRGLLSPMALSAQIRPSNDLMLGLGPVLQDATLQVLKQQGDPAQAAQAAAERLTVSPTK
jgi:multiple sugar transport system substrate-binding protein